MKSPATSRTAPFVSPMLVASVSASAVPELVVTVNVKRVGSVRVPAVSVMAPLPVHCAMPPGRFDVAAAYVSVSPA